MAISNEQCPLSSLADAVKWTEKIVARYGTSPVDKLTLAKAMGYSGLHGTSYESIAALIGYGLIVKVNGEKLRASSEALDISESLPDAPKRVSAIHKAAITPDVFNKLNTEYHEKLPDEAQLASDLAMLGLHHNKIGAAVKAYRDTIKFVNEKTSGSSPTPLEDRTSKQPTQPPSFLNKVVESELGWWRLTTECEAQIKFRGLVTQEALQKLIDHINITMDAYPSKDSTQR